MQLAKDSMHLPQYKKILLQSESKSFIYSQLDQLDFGENPFIFELGKFNKDHDLTASVIEEYFEEHDINYFTYPIVLIGEFIEYSGTLFTAEEVSQAPSFYNIYKNKQLNAKELKKMQILKLKQTQLSNLRTTEFKSTIEEYASAHKQIRNMEKEISFFQRVILQLENTHES